ncbi:MULTISPECIES: hypothetical protein [Bacillus]|uniref:hypothetical protein n=1 Tax=Bacillus TaxID=1386 RepID=UPI0030F4D68A
MDKNIIKKFIEDTKYISFSFEYEEDSGKIRVLDNHGYEISSESATVIIEGMTKAYINLSDVEINNIRKYNAENDLWNYSQSYGPRVLETLFRKNLKKDWGFTCIKCGKKMSSKSDKSWWRIYGPDYESNHKYCSEQCILPVLSKIKEKIKIETYERFGVRYKL